MFNRVSSRRFYRWVWWYFSKGVGNAICYNIETTKAFTGSVVKDDLQVEVTLSDNGGNAFEGSNL